MRSPHLLLALLSLASPAAAEVLVVDAALGAGADYREIQVAVGAAQPGDTILVRAGSYHGFAIDSKALIVTAELGHGVKVAGHVTVRGLEVGEAVALHGLEVQDLATNPALLVRACAGPVWVEDCVLRGPSLPWAPSTDGAHVADSTAVSFHRCTVEGARGLESSANKIRPGDGLVVTDSSVVLLDCIVRGGPTATPLVEPVSPGGTALVVVDSFVVAYGTEVRGGEGQPGNGPFGCLPGGDGGAGLVTLVVEPLTAPTVHLHDTAVAGGLGGPTPEPCAPGQDGPAVVPGGGTVTTGATALRALTLPTPLRYGEAFEARVDGLPGDVVLLVLSPGPSPLGLSPSPDPLQGGPSLLDPSKAWVLEVGVADAAGVATLPLTAPALVSPATFYLEAVALQPSTHVWSSGRLLTLLDPLVFGTP